MANTKGKGLILEVGEPVSFSDSGEVIESSPIWGTETIVTEIYGEVQIGWEWVFSGLEWVITGQIEQVTYEGGKTKWWRMGGTYISDGDFGSDNSFLDPANGTAADFKNVYGPSMCGDYEMYSRRGQNNCNMARPGAKSTQGIVTGKGDVDPADDFDGIEIMDVKTYGRNDFNTNWITDTTGLTNSELSGIDWPEDAAWVNSFDFAFPDSDDDFGYGEVTIGGFGWDYDDYMPLNEQVIEFTCRQFAWFNSTTSDFSASRKCNFGTFAIGEWDYEGFIYEEDMNGIMDAAYYPSIVQDSFWPFDDVWEGFGNMGHRSVHICNEIIHTGWIGYNGELEESNDDLWYNFMHESQYEKEAMSGHESVQGRTLYLYPRSWVMPNTTIPSYRDDDTTGEYDGCATGQYIRWDDAPYDGVLTFDILDAYEDKLFVKGPGNIELGDWINLIPGVDWNGGDPADFFRYYHGVVSHWLHGDGFRPTQIWGKASQSDDTYNETGLEFNSEYLPAQTVTFEAAPYQLSNQGWIGSYIMSNSGYAKEFFSTYGKIGYLGWRSSTKNYWCNDSNLWSQNYGINIEVKASAFNNCKIEIIGDVFNTFQRDTMEQVTDPGTGELINCWGQPPYVFHTLNEDNPNTITAAGGSVRNWAFVPRAYSDSNYKPISQLYNYNIMSAPIRDNYSLNGGSGYLYHYQQYMDYHYSSGTFGEDANQKMSHWEWLRIVPIDDTQPYSVKIDEVRVAPAQMQVSTEYEDVWEYSPTYEQEPVYGWDVVDYEYEDIDVIVDYQYNITDSWDLTVVKQKWEYLDILDEQNTPVSLTFNSGDCKDIKKRNSGYSKTFELPQNKHNQSVLKAISGTTAYRPKESIQWRPARIKSNGIYVFNGYARIEQSISGKGGKYTCHIIEDPSWWPNLIGENKLCDLAIPVHYKTVDFGYQSEVTNPITLDTEMVTWPTITQTWDIQSGSDRGEYNPNGDWQFSAEQGTGLGYVYPAINYGKWNNMTDSDGRKSGKDFHPAYYVRYLIEKIFQNIGYRVQSNFMVSSHFNRLILPYTSGEEYDNLDDMLGIDGNNKVLASAGDYQYWNNVNCRGNNEPYGKLDTEYSTGFPLNNNRVGCYLPRLSAISDQGGNWIGDPANNNNCNPEGGYLVPFTGYYRMRFDTQVRWSGAGSNKWLVVKWLIKRPTHPLYGDSWRIIHRKENSLANTVSFNGNWDEPMMFGDDVVNNTLTGSDFNFDFSFIDEVPYGNTIPFSESYFETNPFGCSDCTTCPELDCFSEGDWSWMLFDDPPSAGISGDTGGGSYDDGQYWMSRGMECTIRLEAGDLINVGYFGYNTNLGKMYLDVKDIELLIFPEPFADDAPPSVMSPAKALGCKMKQLDLIKGVTELFNLHWTADNEKKTIYVEPYDDFYGTGIIRDWTSKLDHSSWTDKFIIDDLAKLINYKYKTDGSDGPINEWEKENEPDFWFAKRIESGELYRKEEVDNGTTVFNSTMHLNDRTFSPQFYAGGSSYWMPVLWSGEDLLGIIEEENDEFSTFSDVWSDIMTDTERPDSSYSFGPRILNYYGTKNDSFQIVMGGLSLTSDRWPSCGAYDYGSFNADPYSLHWDDVTHSNGDVSPGLFTKYWKNLHDKVSGGAALRTCKMALREADVEQLDYRDVIKLKIDGICTYWTINKIVDYKPGKDELTKVELVQFDLPPRVKGQDENYTKQQIGPSKNPPYNDKIEGKKKRERVKMKKGSGSARKNNTKYTVSQSGERGFAVDNNTKNSVRGTGIAIGHNVSAKGKQTVLGKYNKKTASSSLVIGGGYEVKNKRKQTVGVVRQNALTVTKGGDIKYYGGKIVAEIGSGDETTISDIYYKNQYGDIKKLYLRDG